MNITEHMTVPKLCTIPIHGTHYTAWGGAGPPLNFVQLSTLLFFCVCFINIHLCRGCFVTRPWDGLAIHMHVLFVCCCLCWPYCLTHSLVHLVSKQSARQSVRFPASQAVLFCCMPVVVDCGCMLIAYRRRRHRHQHQKNSKNINNNMAATWFGCCIPKQYKAAHNIFWWPVTLLLLSKLGIHF